MIYKCEVCGKEYYDIKKCRECEKVCGEKEVYDNFNENFSIENNILDDGVSIDEEYPYLIILNDEVIEINDDMSTEIQRKLQVLKIKKLLRDLS